MKDIFASHVVPQRLCPYCGYAPDRATWAEGDSAKVKPTVGDFSLCVNCGGLLRFGENFMLERTTPDDWKELTPKQRRLIVAGQEHIRERGPIQRERPN